MGGGFSRIGCANCLDMLNPFPFQVPEEVGEQMDVAESFR